MERQLVKQGRGAMTMTLPSEWVKKNNLTEKDSVQVEEDRGDLIISSNKGKEERFVKLDLHGAPKGLFFHQCLAKYLEGYDKIEVLHDNFSRLNVLSKMLTGMRAEEMEDERIVLRDMIKVPQDNFLEMFKISCRMLIRLVRLLEKKVKGEITLNELKTQEREMDWNIFYCMRYISKYEKVENSLKYFLLCTAIESVGDLLTEIGKHSDKKKFTKKDIENIQLLVDTVEKYVVYLFEGNIKKMYALLRRREEVHKESFVGGLSFAIIENFYNYVGYLTEKN